MWAYGVDYGVRRIAIAAIKGRQIRVVEHHASPKLSDVDVLPELAELLEYELDMRDAGIVCIEAPWARPAHGIKVGLRLAAVGGALALTAREHGSSVEMVPPSVWKKQVIGIGNANKEQVRQWLQATYPAISEACPTQDAADAACLALHGAALLVG